MHDLAIIGISEEATVFSASMPVMLMSKKAILTSACIMSYK